MPFELIVQSAFTERLEGGGVRIRQAGDHISDPAQVKALDGRPHVVRVWVPDAPETAPPKPEAATEPVEEAAEPAKEVAPAAEAKPAPTPPKPPAPVPAEQPAKN